MLMTVNGLLGAAGIPLSRVRLVRHAGTRKRLGNKSPYELWQSGQAAFDAYQAIQKPHRKFNPGDVIASFVATPGDETLFVGLYDVTNVSGLQPRQLTDPVLRDGFDSADESRFRYYHLNPRIDYSDLQGRMIIEWGGGSRSWVQRADRQNKPIVEVRRARMEAPFPGFENFTQTVAELSSLPSGWQTALASVCGVYLLTCCECGRAYVGSASGQGGLWQRFKGYAATGDGGNMELMKHPHRDFQVSILEVLDKSVPRSRILGREQVWKQRLQTRACGLNLN